jgi:hypothetical protein
VPGEFADVIEISAEAARTPAIIEDFICARLCRWRRQVAKLGAGTTVDSSEGGAERISVNDEGVR